jgi:cysteine-rich repeat protein
MCSNPTKPDGAPCNDGLLCTQGDTCHAGTCGGTPLVCTAQDQCHLPGQCDPTTGSCTNPTRPNGSVCDDQNPSTSGDQCVSGVCEGAPVRCGDGVLQPQDGEQCDDGNQVSGDGCSSTCQLEEVCNNLVDDDHDGLIDCQQPVACACSTPARARPHEVPAEIKFVGGLDVMRLHLSIVPTTPISPATEVSGVLLGNANGVLLKATLPAGALASAGGGKRFNYKNLAARITGGITRLQIIKRTGGAYRVELEAFGDLGAATLPVMSLQLSLGNDSFFLTGTWVANDDAGWNLTTP